MLGADRVTTPLCVMNIHHSGLGVLRAKLRLFAARHAVGWNLGAVLVAALFYHP